VYLFFDLHEGHTALGNIHYTLSKFFLSLETGAIFGSPGSGNSSKSKSKLLIRYSGEHFKQEI
jgi:hypothetical protein